MQKPLEGKVAIVAGASRSIGMGAAIELSAAGALVYVLGRTLKPSSGDAQGSLEETVAGIEAEGGRGIAIACDCTDDARLAEVFDRVAKEAGRLDVLVNSVFSANKFAASIGKRFWETSAEFWHDVVDLGARSAYLASRRAAPPMIETVRKYGGVPLIVNVTGRGVLRYRYNVVYGVGKSATERLTRDMALDLREHGVATASIWPNGHPVDPARRETARYNGRAVAALAADPNIMTRSGQHFWSAELGRDYGFTDEFGHHHPIAQLTDDYSLESSYG